jgi:hypothetical protein
VPRKPRMLLFVRSNLTAVAAAALIALSWGAAAGLASADPPAPAPAPPGPAPGAPPGPGPKTTIDHDGTFAVGTDIAPGTYSSAGPIGNGACYWKRVGAGDDGKQVLDNAMSKKPQVVRIDPTDKAFKTDGCQPWQQNDALSPDPGRPPAEAGMQLGILNALLNPGGGPQPNPGGPQPNPGGPQPPKP